MGKRKRCDVADEEAVEGSPPSKLVFTDGQMFTSVHDQAGYPLPVQSQQVEADLRKVMDDFVNVYEKLDSGDDPLKKPNYSYTELVYLAVLRSPNFCLPITEIYNYIKCRFTFFRDSHRTHWKNAVRHSLSKTKCFTKIAVGKRHGLPGLPNRSSFLWCIVPTSIVSFARGDYRPAVDKESGMNTLRWGYYKVNAGQFWSQVAVYLERKFEMFQSLVATSSDPRAIVKFQVCSLPEVAPETGTSSPEVRVHMGDNSGDIVQNTFQVGFGDESDFLPKLELNDSFLTGCVSTDDELSPKPSSISSLSMSVNDSGHETLDSSPDEGLSDETWRCQKRNLNSSYLSFLPSQPNPDRLTPELPDLGHVSPFELSPLSSHSASPPPSLLTSAQNLLRISPVPMAAQFHEPYSSYYSPYQASHVMYPTLQDLAYSYPVNYYYPINGQDPMLSAIPEWTGH